MPRLGKVTVILGRNGVGKTTLLKSHDGPSTHQEQAASTFDGKPIARNSHLTSAPAWAWALCHKGREIFARLTVEENLRMGLAYKKCGHPHSGRAV